MAALAGLVAGAMLALGALDDARDAGIEASLARPGEEQILTIVDPGGYTIAYVGPLVVFGTGEQQDLAADLGIDIRPVGGGDPLALAPYEGLHDLEEGGTQYVPLLTVHVAEPGDYVFRSRLVDGLDRSRSVLVVTRSPWRILRDGVVTAVAVAAVAVALAVLATVILAVTRGRAKRQAGARDQPSPPWGPSPWSPPGSWT